MKKILFLILASFLVLAACGNEEESKLDNTKETKSEDKESKKDDRDSDKESDEDKDKDKSDEKQKSEDISSEEVAAQDESTEEALSQEQVNTQEQQSTQQPAQSQQAPTLQEKANANAKVAKEHGYTGIPNGDAMSDVPVGQIELPPEELAKEEAKPEYQDVVETEEEADKRIGE